MDAGVKWRVLSRLRELRSESFRDPEKAHGEADDLLLALIDDAEISVAFEGIIRYYA